MHARRHRGQCLRRLRHVLGPVDPGSRASRRRRRRCGGGRARHVVWRADRSRNRISGTRVRGDAVDRKVALLFERNRGDDERFTSGTRLHRTREGDQVRRLLPRSRRRILGRGRQRRTHARGSRFARRHRRRRRRHPRVAVQRSGRRARRLPRASACDRRGHRRAVRRQHGAGSGAAGILGGAARADARARRALDLR